MLIRKAFKFRLKLTSDIEMKLNQFAGCCRFVWNKALYINLDRLSRKQPILLYQELNFWNNLWKASLEYGFLNECHSQVFQQKLKDLDKAFKDAFDKTQPNKRLPRYKKKGIDDRFRFPQGFKVERKRLYLPKIGWVKFFDSQKIMGTPKNLTISKKGAHWYASIQTEYEILAPTHASKSIVGIDMGIVRFATLSNTTYIEPKSSFRCFEKKLAKAQRRLSKKIKFSNNWKKQKIKIQKIHAEIVHHRIDFLHKSSHQISKNHAIIVMEDLKISNMTRSAKGDVESPGKNVKAKSGLNKSILDQGWYTFRQQLCYKQAWKGGMVLLVNPKNTSITCPHCDYVCKENRKSQSEFECKKCCYRNHADVVGAINIQRAGHAQLACGVAPLGATMKQEPTKVAA